MVKNERFWCTFEWYAWLEPLCFLCNINLKIKVQERLWCFYSWLWQWYHSYYWHTQILTWNDGYTPYVTCIKVYFILVHYVKLNNIFMTTTKIDIDTKKKKISTIWKKKYCLFICTWNKELIAHEERDETIYEHYRVCILYSLFCFFSELSYRGDQYFGMDNYGYYINQVK